MPGVVAVAAVDGVDDRLPVDREVDGLADADVVPRLRIALDRDLQLPERRGAALQDDEVAVVLERAAPSVETRGAVDRAGPQGGDPRLLVGKRLQRHRVHVRLALLPEALVGHVLDPVVRVEADHPVGPGADRVAADVDLVVEPGGDDRRVAAPGEEAEHARVAGLQAEPGDVLRDDVDAQERRHLADRRDAARQRRVQHLLDRVLDVPRVELLAVVELDALAEVEGDRLLVGRDLPRLCECGLQVQVLVPLDERVVRGLLAPVVRGQDRAERRDVDRVLLERPDEPPPVLDLRRCEGVLPRGLRGAGHGSGGRCTCSDDPCLLRARYGGSTPCRSRSLVVSMSDTATSLLSCGPVRGSDRPWEPHPRSRRRRRIRAPGCLRGGSRPRGRSRRRGPVRP